MSIYLVGVPGNKQKIIKATIAITLKTAKEKLRYAKPVDVVVIESQPFFVIPEIGIVGTAVGKRCIEIKIDFARKDLQKIISRELLGTIFHEFAHLARENTVGYGDALVDALVGEGLACYIEQQLARRNIPYIKAIRGESAWLKKLSKLAQSKKYDYNEWFLGTGSLPRWLGYRLGYLMIEQYAHDKHISLATLVRVKSRDVLRSLKK